VAGQVLARRKAKGRLGDNIMRMRALERADESGGARAAAVVLGKTQARRRASAAPRFGARRASPGAKLASRVAVRSVEQFALELRERRGPLCQRPGDFNALTSLLLRKHKRDHAELRSECGDVRPWRRSSAVRHFAVPGAGGPAQARFILEFAVLDTRLNVRLGGWVCRSCWAPARQGHVASGPCANVV
jgi:hypothetical protein